MTDTENLTAEEISELMDASRVLCPTGGECPHCGESRIDWLTWNADMETVTCQACGVGYTP